MNIFITGGTRGIGNGLVKVFLEHKHNVAFTGTSAKSIDRAKKTLSGNYRAIICDVRNMDDLKSACNQAVESFGSIDIWINNAGVGQEDVYFEELNPNQIQKVIDTNVLGTMFGTNVALHQMHKQSHGAIYNLEGLGSNNMIIPKTIVYGASKRLITYFTKGVRKELKNKENIFIGTIQPGMVFTDLLLKNMPENGMKIANILGNDVDYVAKKVYKGLIKRKKKIQVSSTLEVLWRFVKSIFVKEKRYEKD